MSQSSKVSDENDTPAHMGDPVGVSHWAVQAERFGLLVVLAIAIAIFGILKPGVFLSAANWQALISAQSVVLVISLALMVPLVAGNFDLSVGTIAIMSSIIAAGAMSRSGLPLWVAFVFAVVGGFIIGIVNGFLVTKIRLNSLIATLGTSAIIQGLVDLYTGGSSIANNIPGALTKFGSSRTFGISNLALIAVVIALIIMYVQMKTPYGRRLSAIGSSKPAAQLVGIRVNRVVFVSFVISGTLGGLAGMMMLAQQGSGNPAANGLSVLLPALTAVYLGASTLFPGKFNVPGTILGLVLVAVIVSGLTLLGVQSWVQGVTIGLALIIAVGASETFRRQRR
jgi:ribose transport system permease protein